MKKKIMRLWMSLLCFLIAFGHIIPANAASCSLSGSSSIEAGKSITISGSVSAVHWNLTLYKDGEVVDSTSKTSGVDVESGSVGYTLTTTSADAGKTITFTLSGDYSVCDDDYNVTITPVNKTCTITVTAPPPPPSGGDSGNSGSSGNSGNTGNSGSSGNSGNTGNSGNSGNSGTTQTTPTKSSEARLSSLTVDKGELSPKFDPSVTNYSVKVTTEESEITINASAKHSKAKVSGTGTKPIKLGDNSFAIDVTAEDGTKKSYIVNVEVVEEPMTYLEYNNEQYGVLKEYDATEVPKGFEPKKGLINEEENTIFVNKGETLTLIYALSPDEMQGFYLYDQDEGIIGLYRPLIVDGREVYIIPIPENLQTRTAMAFATMSINEEELQVWTFDDDQLVGYSLLYVMDETGEKSYYLYDETETKLLQYPDSTPVTYDDFVKAGLINQEPVNYGLYGGIGAVLVVLLILILVSKKKKNKKVETVVEEKEVEPEIKEEIVSEPEVVEEHEVHTIDTDLNKIKDYQEYEIETNMHIEEIVKPIIPIVEDEEDNDWISEDFYKSIFEDKD